MTSSALFARRPNRDGSADSICTTCYQTIATAWADSDLQAEEHRHQCIPPGEFSRFSVLGVILARAREAEIAAARAVAAAGRTGSGIKHLAFVKK